MPCKIIRFLPSRKIKMAQFRNAELFLSTLFTETTRAIYAALMILETALAADSRLVSPCLRR